MRKSFYNWIESKSDDRMFYVIRGLPGAGKSTTAKKILEKLGGSPDGHVFSTDSYWTPESRKLRRAGQYVPPEDEKAEYRKNWDGEKIGKAHESNKAEFRLAVDNGVTPLVLDNVNTRRQDFKSYAEYADKAGYEIRIVEPESEWWKANAHLLKDKKEHAREIDKFAELLCKKTQHGVPLSTIKRMIQRWQPTLTVEDVLGREPTPKHKRTGAPNKKRVEKKDKK